MGIASCVAKWYGLGMTTTQIDARAKYLTADWSLQDSVLGRLLGVSRERVRQVRRKLGKPPAVHHGQNNRDRSHDMMPRLAKVLDQCCADMKYASLRAVAEVAGVDTSTVRVALVAARVDTWGALIHPWPLMNWALPNIDLATIWGLTCNLAGTNRARHGKCKASWHRQHGAVPTDTAYADAILVESLAAQSWRRDKAEARERLFSALRGLGLQKRPAGVAIGAAAV